MTQAKTGDSVRVHFVGTLDDGEEFDSSHGGDPLEFTIGGESIMPAFGEAVVGLSAGETKDFTVPAELAYGPVNEDMLQEVERSDLPEGLDLEVGMKLQAEGPNGEAFIVSIADVRDETVILDANHPLAGQDLTFEIELVEVL